MEVKNEKHIPIVGDYILGDEWRVQLSKQLKEDAGFKDDSFPGCDFRLELGGQQMACNIKVTGKPRIRKNSGKSFQSRCKIEIVGDGESPTFFGGIIIHD